MSITYKVANVGDCRYVTFEQDDLAVSEMMEVAAREFPGTTPDKLQLVVRQQDCNCCTKITLTNRSV